VNVRSRVVNATREDHDEGNERGARQAPDKQDADLDGRVRARQPSRKDARSEPTPAMKSHPRLLHA
jgi:hypothetical protein